MLIHERRVGSSVEQINNYSEYLIVYLKLHEIIIIDLVYCSGYKDNCPTKMVEIKCTIATNAKNKLSFKK